MHIAGECSRLTSQRSRANSKAGRCTARSSASRGQAKNPLRRRGRGDDGLSSEGYAGVKNCDPSFYLKKRNNAEINSTSNPPTIRTTLTKSFFPIIVSCLFSSHFVLAHRRTVELSISGNITGADTAISFFGVLSPIRPVLFCENLVNHLFFSQPVLVISINVKQEGLVQNFSPLV